MAPFDSLSTENSERGGKKDPFGYLYLQGRMSSDGHVRSPWGHGGWSAIGAGIATCPLEPPKVQRQEAFGAPTFVLSGAQHGMGARQGLHKEQGDGTGGGKH